MLDSNGIFSAVRQRHILHLPLLPAVTVLQQLYYHNTRGLHLQTYQKIVRKPGTFTRHTIGDINQLAKLLLYISYISFRLYSLQSISALANNKTPLTKNYCQGCLNKQVIEFRLVRSVTLLATRIPHRLRPLLEFTFKKRYILLPILLLLILASVIHHAHNPKARMLLARRSHRAVVRL